MNTRTYRSAYSTLFQDFNLYAASVAENVSMNLNSDLEKVRDALICARIPKAADQLDGIISKEFRSESIFLAESGSGLRLHAFFMKTMIS